MSSELNNQDGVPFLSVSRLQEWVWSGIAIFSTGLVIGMVEWLFPDKEPLKIPPKLVLQVGALAVLIPLFLGVLCIRLWLRGRRLRAWGFEWDRDGNPICAKCAAPLSPDDGSHLKCPCCDVRYSMMAFGRPSDPQYVWDAIDMMKARLGRK